jgi:hypothetical protein
MIAHESLRWDPSKLHFEFPLPNRETRFKELVLYISDECIDDPTYSETKLYKILFYSEFEAYGRYGAPITGRPYRKLQFGPAPAGFRRIQEEMLQDRLIRVIKRRVYDHAMQRILPMQDSKVEVFSAREISIVDRWIRFFWNMRAKEISRFSHGKAWKLADMGEYIPYEAVFISDEPVTYDDVDRVKDLAGQHGWKL